VIFLGAMVGLRLTPLLSSETILVHVVPVDPRQLFRAEIEAMHHEAHERCFIANSVRTDVRCEPVALRASGELRRTRTVV